MMIATWHAEIVCLEEVTQLRTLPQRFLSMSVLLSVSKKTLVAAIAHREFHGHL